MQGESAANHVAIAAWIDGQLTPAQRQEFEAHLATCADCQAEVSELLKVRLTPPAPPAPAIAEAHPAVRPPRNLWLILAFGLLVLIVGYGLGWAAWQLINR